MSEVLPGVLLGFSVKNVSVKDVCGGGVVGDSKNYPPKEEAGFTAEVIILNYTGQTSARYEPVLDCRPAHSAHRFVKLKEINHHSKKKLGDSKKNLLRPQNLTGLRIQYKLSRSDHIKFSLKCTNHFELKLFIKDKGDFQNTC